MPKAHEDTALRTPVSFSKMDIEVASKDFYEKKRLLEINVLVKERGNGIPIDLGVNIKEKSDTEVAFKKKIVKITDQYYVIFVHGLPDKWKSVSFYFYDKNESKSVMKSDQKIYVSSAKAEKHDRFIPQKDSFYEVKYTNLLMKDAEKIIKEEQKMITKANENQNELKQKIESLEEELDYKTEAEKAEVNQTISSLTLKIEGYKREKTDREKLIREQQGRIKNLKKKKQELEVQ